MNGKEVRILFLGTPDIAAFVLEALILNGYNIIGIVSQEDKERNRKGELIKTPTHECGDKYNIPVYEFDKISKHVNEVKALNPELILTLAYGQIVSEEILNLPKYGCINLHGSLLPKMRGAAPIQRSLYNGDNLTGFTLMEMVKEMDAGRMYAKKEVNISEDDNYTSLLEKMKICARDLILESIDDYVNGKLIGEPQDIKEVTFANKITKEEEKLFINDNCKDFINKVRCLSYTPGGYLILDNEKIKIFKAKYVSNITENELGTIVKYDKNGFFVQLSDGIVSLLEVQKPGKKILNYKDFINGNRDLLGKKFE